MGNRRPWKGDFLFAPSPGSSGIGGWETAAAISSPGPGSSGIGGWETAAPGRAISQSPGSARVSRQLRNRRLGNRRSWKGDFLFARLGSRLPAAQESAVGKPPLLDGRFPIRPARLASPGSSGIGGWETAAPGWAISYSPGSARVSRQLRNRRLGNRRSWKGDFLFARLGSRLPAAQERRFGKPPLLRQECRPSCV